MEKGFVYIDDIVSNIRWDAKYATWDNFTGKPVDGYNVNRIIGTIELCRGIAEVQQQAESMGYGLLLWDGYRPQCAVDCFLKWSKQPENFKTKQNYYPNINKLEIINKGYVAKKSSHSRGAAIDLTLFYKSSGELVPMGGNFDFMDTISHHEAKEISQEERKNRDYLKIIMENSGFEAFENEWWHYTLKYEPYPNKYFNFTV